jgi:hypothetical protein
LPQLTLQQLQHHNPSHAANHHHLQLQLPRGPDLVHHRNHSHNNTPSSSTSNANFQFGEGGTVLPNAANATSATHSHPHPHLPPPANHGVSSSNHFFSRSVSTKNVSDLRRTRDKFFGGAMGGLGGGGGNTPLNALKNLAQQRAAAAVAAAAGAGRGTAAPPARVQVASILNLPSHALLDALRTGNNNNNKRDAPSHHHQQQQQQQQQQYSALSHAQPPHDDGGEESVSHGNHHNHLPMEGSMDGSMRYPAASKRARVAAAHEEQREESALHRACCREGVTPVEIFQLLQGDPTAASRPEVLYSHRQVYDPSAGQGQLRLAREPYRYALNLAIYHRQSADVLDMLMNVAPDVLVSPDGKERENPLCVLVKCSPGDVDSVDRMLLLKPKCVAFRDRNGNTALHLAATRRTALDAVRHMCILYPESQRMRNRHGKTPLGLATHYTSTCPEAVANYLLDQQQQHTALYYAA